MADYQANARTNYFLVKDVDALKADLSKYGIFATSWEESQRGAEFVLDEGTDNKPKGAIALFSFGTWPALDEESVVQRLDIEDEETPVPTEYEGLHELVAAHLVEGEVAIFMEVGFEKMRYLGAIALAVNSAGETRRVDLDDIYGLANDIASDGHLITRTSY